MSTPGGRLSLKYKKSAVVGEKKRTRMTTKTAEELEEESRWKQHVNKYWERNNYLQEALQWSWEDAIKFNKTQLKIRWAVYSGDLRAQLNDNYKNILPIEKWPGYNNITKTKGYQHFTGEEVHFDYAKQPLMVWFLMINGLTPLQTLQYMYTIDIKPNLEQFKHIKHLIYTCHHDPNSRKTWTMPRPE